MRTREPIEITAIRADALFASSLQSSDSPTMRDICQAVRTALLSNGEAGCAALVAYEFGEHPNEAVNRMRWVLGTLMPTSPSLAAA